MKITQIETVVSGRPPAARPIRDALQTLSGGGDVQVRVHTDAGLVGEGSAFFGRIDGAPRALQVLIDEELAPIALHRDVFHVREIHEELKRETEYHGFTGITMFGIAAIDTALWDLIGKACDRPCLQLWGISRDRVPAYAMVGWLNYSPEELKPIGERAVEQGFRAVKIKVGSPTIEEDVARIEAVRSVVGPGVKIMVDANQVHTVAEALARGRVYEQMGCHWYEEPIPAHDYDGHAALAAGLGIPLATGENLYGKEEFEALLSRRGADLVQPDLRRAGGPTEVMAIAQMAAARGLPWASHGGGAVMLSLLCAMPGGAWLETGFVTGRFPILEDGCALAPRGPGFAWE
jgi:L-alanine-DL-glutamate epimerase-like enolase superfamily enzyme